MTATQIVKLANLRQEAQAKRIEFVKRFTERLREEYRDRVVVRHKLEESTETHANGHAASYAIYNVDHVYISVKLNQWNEKSAAIAAQINGRGAWIRSSEGVLDLDKVFVAFSQEVALQSAALKKDMEGKVRRSNMHAVLRAAFVPVDDYGNLDVSGLVINSEGNLNVHMTVSGDDPERLLRFVNFVRAEQKAQKGGDV
jgi:hypothetical protein